MLRTSPCKDTLPSAGAHVKSLLPSVPTVDEVLALTGVPRILLLGNSRVSERAIFDRTIRFIRGELSVSTAIVDALDTDIFSAVELYLVCEGLDALEGTKRRLEEEWHTWFMKTQGRKARLHAAVAKLHMDESAPIDELRGVEDFLDAAVPSDRLPSSVQELRAEHDVEEQLALVEEELEQIQGFVAQQTALRRQAELDLVDRVGRRLIAQLASSESDERDAAARLIAHLPGMISARDFVTLRAVEDAALLGEVRFQSMGYHTLPDRRPAAPRPSGAPSVQRFQTSSSTIVLDLISRQTLDQGRIVELYRTAQDPMRIAWNDYRALEGASGVRFWTDVATSVASERDQRLARGLALLELGRDTYLRDGNRRYAQRTLDDSVALLAPFRDEAVHELESATMALIISLDGDRAAARRRGDSQAYYSDLFSDFEGVAALAERWVRVRHDATARELLQVASTSPAWSTFIAGCASTLLRRHEFESNPRRTIERLSLLTEIEQSGAPLRACLDELADLLPASGQGRNVDARPIHGVASRVEAAAGLLSETGVLPRLAILDSLPETLRLYSGVRRSAPNLRVRLLTVAVWPKDCGGRTDLYLEVSNANDAAVAEFVSVDVRIISPVAGAVVEGPRIEIGELGPGEERELPVRVNLRDVDLDRITEVVIGIELRNADSVEHSESKVSLRPESRERISNPYNTGEAVEGNSFFGRERETREVLKALTDDDARAALIYGFRRFGKTSLLKQVKANPTVAASHFVVYHDLQDVSDSPRKLFLDLAREILGAVNSVQRPDLDMTLSVTRDAADVFRDAIHAVTSMPRGRRVLLCLDEFDALLEHVRVNEAKKLSGASISDNDCLTERALATLRSAVMTFGKSFRLIVAGTPKILDQGYSNRLYGLMIPIELRAFTEANADDVINAGAGVFVPSSSARRRVRRETGMHPYLLQIVCYYLFQRAVEQGRNFIVESDVEFVVRRDVLTKESYFGDYASLISEEQTLIYGLACATKSRAGKRMYVSVEEVVQSVRERGVDLDTEEVLSGLTTLAGHDQRGSSERVLIERDPNNHRRFRFVVGMLVDRIMRMYRI
jgi:hypothetical protein